MCLCPRTTSYTREISVIDRFFDTPVGIFVCLVGAGGLVWYVGAVVYYTIAAVLSWLKHLCHC